MNSKTFTDIPHGATCVSLLKKLSEEKPDKQAYMFIDKHGDTTVLTRKDVWDRSRKFAAILRSHGVEKGDIVCNTLVNSPQRLYTSLGTILAGGISMHSQVTPPAGADFIHNCKLSKCQAVIVDPGLSDGAVDVLTRIQNKDTESGNIRYTDLPRLTIVINVRVCQDDTSDHNNTPCNSANQYLEHELDMYEEADIQENDIAFIFPTSGTTGFPKLVPHSHRNFLLSGRLLSILQGIQSEESRFFSDRELGWLGGSLGPFLITGATHVLTDLSKGLPDSMDRHILRLFNEGDVDCGILLARDIELIDQLINSGAKLNKRLNAFGITGMPHSRRVLKAFDVITDSMNIGFGATEVGYASVLHLDPETPFEDFCIGVAAEGYEIKVVNENLIELPVNKIGQVIVSSLSRTLGYLNEPEKTEKAFTKDGWMKVGDTAYRDEMGRIYLLGREADAIHKGDSIHYPGWMESHILKCPEVKNVIVIGVPDEINGEEICVCAIPSDEKKLTIQQLQNYCKTQYTNEDESETSAMPKYFLFLKSFPCNNNGKIDRKVLRMQAYTRLQIN